jgi:hypothetical protein
LRDEGVSKGEGTVRREKLQQVEMRWRGIEIEPAKGSPTLIESLPRVRAMISRRRDPRISTTAPDSRRRGSKAWIFHPLAGSISIPRQRISTCCNSLRGLWAKTRSELAIPISRCTSDLSESYERSVAGIPCEGFEYDTERVECADAARARIGDEFNGLHARHVNRRSFAWDPSD